MSAFDLFAFDDLGLDAELFGDPMADPLDIPDPMLETDVMITETTWWAEFWVVPDPAAAAAFAAPSLFMPSPFDVISTTARAGSLINKGIQALRRNRAARDLKGPAL